MMDIYQQALHTYGVGNQLRKLAEEAAELAVAALHVAGVDGDIDWARTAQVAEEAADVEIMLSQLRLLMADMIDEQKRYKLIRLRSRLGRDWKPDATTTADSTQATQTIRDAARAIDAVARRGHTRYICTCGQAVQVQAMGDGFDAVGVGNQLRKLAEEAAELAVAALHVAGVDGDIDWARTAQVAEEAADVEIMLSQLRLLMADMIDEQKRYKLIRLRSRLGRDWKPDATTTADSTQATQTIRDAARAIDAVARRGHTRYICTCGQAVQVQAMGDGFDAVLEIPCPSCGGRMIPEVDDDR
jgi:NTP pyrophosphatase (non-canonical NTP hydrolase)/DNA-directed RNA polymerase subunit RPC12/RpoP